MKIEKERLDVLLVKRGLVESRQRALAHILAGSVWVDGNRTTKAGTKIPTDASIHLKGNEIPYVSRGGMKLEAALKEYSLNIKGLMCLDVGASTGGFTDCLLQHGAEHVVAVDVGYGQLHWKLRSDPRVTVLERTNIRNLDHATLPHPVDVISVDVSFISLRIVIPAVLPFLKSDGFIICLIKPQFEVGKGLVGKGGVVRDPELRQKTVKDLMDAFKDLGLKTTEPIPSPILGPKGNQEYLAVLTPDSSVLPFYHGS